MLIIPLRAYKKMARKNQDECPFPTQKRPNSGWLGTSNLSVFGVQPIHTLEFRSPNSQA